MTATLWIGGAGLVAVVVAVWRLRRAARTLRRILAEEAERTEPEPSFARRSSPLRR